jgi:hypothetical protein
VELAEERFKEAERALRSLHARPGAKDTAAKPSDLEREDDKIRTLIAEGKPQKQAVAIALDLKRRGEL